jgi:hypothetical protein
MLLRLTLLGLLAALPAACATPPVIAMWNPTTGEFHDCKTAQVSYLIEWHPATDCAADYQAKGWRLYY